MPACPLLGVAAAAAGGMLQALSCQLSEVVCCGAADARRPADIEWRRPSPRLCAAAGAAAGAALWGFVAKDSAELADTWCNFRVSLEHAAQGCPQGWVLAGGDVLVGRQVLPVPG